MAIKTVDTIRKIRDKNYEETKKMSKEEQIRLINQKAEKLRNKYKHNEKKIA